MSIVVRLYLNSGGLGGIAEKNDGNADSGFVFSFDGNGGLHFNVERSAADMRVNSAGGVIPVGQWVQVAVTWDGTAPAAANAHLYLNGSELSKTQNNDGVGTIGYANATNKPFLIGNSTFDSSGSLDGKMAYLAVYNGRILTPAELKQLDAGLPVR